MEQKCVTIKLSPAEALVLFEWLARSDNDHSIQTEHPAELKALWRLEGELEGKIDNLFSKEYRVALQEARSELIRLYGE
jgi:hypothetical protein